MSAYNRASILLLTSRILKHKASLREAYQLLAASTQAQIKDLLQREAVTADLSRDQHAWALAAYQVTYRIDFAKYLNADWSRLNLEITQDDEKELEEELAEAGVLEKKYLSFAWLFPEELIHLKLDSHVLNTLV